MSEFAPFNRYHYDGNCFSCKEFEYSMEDTESGICTLIGPNVYRSIGDKCNVIENDHRGEASL